MNDHDIARNLIQRYPQFVIVDGDCGHSGPKQRHHYDYKKPFNVKLLCSTCHGRQRSTFVGETISSHRGPVMDFSLIRRYRIEKGLTQEGLAKLMGKTFTKSRICSMEKGRTDNMTVKTLELLMFALDKNAEDFLQ